MILGRLSEASVFYFFEPATHRTEKQTNGFSPLLLSVLRLGSCQWNWVVACATGALLVPFRTSLVSQLHVNPPNLGSQALRLQGGATPLTSFGFYKKFQYQTVSCTKAVEKLAFRNSKIRPNLVCYSKKVWSHSLGTLLLHYL